MPTIESIRDIVRDVACQHGVERVFLFGSYARGEAKPGSDIDLRIDEGQLTTLFRLGGFYADLEERLSVPVDVVVTDSLTPNFLSRINKDEVILYER